MRCFILFQPACTASEEEEEERSFLLLLLLLSAACGRRLTMLLSTFFSVNCPSASSRTYSLTEASVLPRNCRSLPLSVFAASSTLLSSLCPPLIRKVAGCDGSTFAGLKP